MSSAQSYPLLSRLVAAAVNVSQRSATILRDIKKSGELNIQEKEANDYVTKADFQSQLNIIKSLEKQFPKLKFCGEEGELKDEYNDLELTFNDNVLQNSKQLPSVYDSLKEEDLFVWVDPLDGTKEYTQGADVAHEVTVLIGISHNGRPIAGVVNQPFFQENSGTDLGRVLWGIVGLGAFDLKSGKLSAPKRQGDQRTIVTTRSHITEIVKRDLSNMPNTKLLQAGGAGYKVIAVVDGKADCYLYPRDGTKRWDTCAPEAILRALNGTLTDIYGNDYSYKNDENSTVQNCYGLVASLDQDNSFYVNHLSEELKNLVKSDAEKVKAKLHK